MLGSPPHDIVAYDDSSHTDALGFVFPHLFCPHHLALTADERPFTAWKPVWQSDRELYLRARVKLPVDGEIDAAGRDIARRANEGTGSLGPNRV